ERPQDFTMVLDRLAPRRMGLDLAVPGEWLTCPANEPRAEWVLIGETPRKVVLLDQQVYRLEITSRATDRDLESLVQMWGLTGLQKLRPWGGRQVTDAGLAHLRGLTGLQNLVLLNCEGVTGAGLAHLRGLTGLQQLVLSVCSQVTDAGLAHL